MKKVLFVLVSLLLVSTCFALESGPSNKVGYVKIVIAGGSVNAVTPFGLPFVFWDVPTGNVPTYGTESRKPSDVFGTQAQCGSIPNNSDRVVEQDGGRTAFRRTASLCGWSGTLETDGGDLGALIPYKCYNFFNYGGIEKTLILAGEADTTAVGIPAVTINPAVSATVSSYRPYSWRDPRELAFNKLNLVQAGFRGAATVPGSDKILQQRGGGQAWYNTTTNAWVPGASFTAIQPGAAYYITNKHFGLPGYTYTYLANGAALTMPNGDEPEMMKARTSKETSTTKTGRTAK